MALILLNEQQLMSDTYNNEPGLTQAAIDVLLADHRATIDADTDALRLGLCGEALTRIDHSFEAVAQWFSKVLNTQHGTIILLQGDYTAGFRFLLTELTEEARIDLITDIRGAFAAHFQREQIAVQLNASNIIRAQRQKAELARAAEMAGVVPDENGEIWLTRKEYAHTMGLTKGSVSSYLKANQVPRKKGHGHAKLYQYIQHLKNNKKPRIAKP